MVEGWGGYGRWDGQRGVVRSRSGEAAVVWRRDKPLLLGVVCMMATYRKGSMRRYFAVVAVVALALVGCQSDQKVQWSQETRLVSLNTEPQGARVWQIVAPSGGRVDLGMTPIVDRQVMVMTKYRGSFTDMASAQNMMSSLNVVRLRIEKPGYQPYDLTMTPYPNLPAQRTVKLEPETVTSAER